MITPPPPPSKSKKKQLLELDVYAKELMVDLSHIEKKEENLKDRKKKMITPPRLLGGYVNAKELMVNLSHLEQKEENLKDRKKKMITPPPPPPPSKKVTRRVSEFLDYIQDDKGKQNLDKEVIKSKKKQLLESDVYAKELMVNLFHLEKKEENLKDRKKKIITPPPPSPSKKHLTQY
ncbi:hypothetical protein TSUD_336090 [Trifolium subterraneum]|uniref:Uncharacterized protein n=1 Tax=Trifolium subterraneum TaxID=3900 RepID=A0A2Z6MB05_TRISU|nr:hypothetical protein TSUD_336090 [Trifolium subterraneum]